MVWILEFKITIGLGNLEFKNKEILCTNAKYVLENLKHPLV